MYYEEDRVPFDAPDPEVVKSENKAEKEPEES